MRGLLLVIPAHHCLEQRGVLPWWRRDVVMAHQCREHTSTFLGTRDFLAAPFLSRGRWTQWISSRGRAPWGQGAFLGRRWWRHLLLLASCAGWRARQREGWHGRAPCCADELGDAGEPILIEVVNGTIVQELTRQEQRNVHVHGGATGVG